MTGPVPASTVLLYMAPFSDSSWALRCWSAHIRRVSLPARFHFSAALSYLSLRFTGCDAFCFSAFSATLLPIPHAHTARACARTLRAFWTIIRTATFACSFPAHYTTRTCYAAVTFTTYLPTHLYAARHTSAPRQPTAPTTLSTTPQHRRTLPTAVFTTYTCPPLATASALLQRVLTAALAVVLCTTHATRRCPDTVACGYTTHLYTPHTACGGDATLPAAFRRALYLVRSRTAPPNCFTGSACTARHIPHFARRGFTPYLFTCF